MNSTLDAYLKGHPDHAAESLSRSRSLGPRASDFRRQKPDKTEEEALGLLAHMEIARQRLDMAIKSLKSGLAAYRT
jgi:hypothetical protein